MEKIISGLRYDTESDSAQLVAKWQNMADRGDFNYVREELYLTDNGNFFLYGKGHARSKYATTTPDGMKGSGEDIMPKTEDQAYRWLERRNQTEAIKKHFADRIEPA
jgi:hypothetical protein